MTTMAPRNLKTTQKPTPADWSRAKVVLITHDQRKTTLQSTAPDYSVPHTIEFMESSNSHKIFIYRHIQMLKSFTWTQLRTANGEQAEESLPEANPRTQCNSQRHDRGRWKAPSQPQQREQESPRSSRAYSGDGTESSLPNLALSKWRELPARTVGNPRPPPQDGATVYSDVADVTWRELLESCRKPIFILSIVGIKKNQTKMFQGNKDKPINLWMKVVLMSSKQTRVCIIYWKYISLIQNW